MVFLSAERLRNPLSKLIAALVCAAAASAAVAQNPKGAASRVTPERAAKLAAMAKLRIPTGPMNGIVADRIKVKFSKSQAAYYAMTRPQSVTIMAGVEGSAQNLAQLSFINRIGPSGWTEWRIPAGTDPKALAKVLKTQPGVIAAEPVFKIYPLLPTPNDADWAVQETDPNLILDLTGENGDLSFRRLWHLDDNNAFAGWQSGPNTWYTAATKPRNAPLIAVIDTGIDDTHRDFINSGGTGQDVTQGGQFFLNLSTQFTLGAANPAGSIHDTNGHGTHVAGLALAAGNNGAYQGGGVIGIGYCANGMILRVFDNSGNGTDDDAAAAMYYAADNHADIISLSLGDTSYSQAFQDATTYCTQSGSLVVAAGNENGNGGGALGPIYPAACSGALAVTAAGPEYSVAVDYAGSGNYVDIAAPGGEVIQNTDYIIIQYVYSTACGYECDLTDLSNEGQLYPPYNPYYTYLAGTSMATPQVSGAAAVYYASHGIRQRDGYSNIQAYRALEKAANGQDGAPYGSWEPVQGYGNLDVGAAVTDTDARGSQVGAIKGIVYSNSTPISNVQVKAKNVNGGVTYSTTTAADGTYRFASMPGGIYNVTTAPFGQAKTKQALVKNGSDLPGFDFWCGTYSGDVTPPTVNKFAITGLTHTTLTLQQWGLDVDTGIDSIVVRIGTTPGGTDIMPDTALLPDGNTSTFSGLTIPAGRIFVQATYTNGGGLTTTVQASNYASAVQAKVTLGEYAGSAQPITLELRNPGSTTDISTVTLTPDGSGNVTWLLNQTGTYDIAFKASHWLKKVLHNVVLPNAGTANVNVTLTNGDINGNNVVDFGDYVKFIGAYGTTSASSNWNPNADLNGDGAVGFSDYVILIEHYGQSGDQ
jgi:hypothetical protein